MANSPLVRISDWRPYHKNTLRGFFTATLPSGLVLHGLMLHQRGDHRWIGFPAREWLNAENVKQYARWIEFVDEAANERFHNAVLNALDLKLSEVRP